MTAFRASTQADLPQLSELLSLAFDVHPGANFLDPALFHWKYWDAREDWSEPRSYVIETAGRIVAHAGIWPVEFLKDGRLFRGIHMIDWASRKDAPGAGLALVQKLMGLYDFIFAIGGSEATKKALPAYGFTEAGRTWTAARPLHPIPQVLTHQFRNWKLPVRLVRNFYWSMAPPAQANGWAASEIAPEQLQTTSPDGQVNAEFSPRPLGFFQYLSRCPAVRFRFYQIIAQDQPQGHFVLGLTRGQARLAYLGLRESGEEALRRGYAVAEQAARRLAGANEIVARCSEGLASQAAVRCGLRLSGSAPVYLRTGKGGFRFPKEFQFQLAENDEAFLDSGEFSYIT